MGGSIFIRLAIVGSQICEIPQNSERIQTYTLQVKVMQGHRSSCQSKAHMHLPLSH